MASDGEKSAQERVAKLVAEAAEAEDRRNVTQKELREQADLSPWTKLKRISY